MIREPWKTVLTSDDGEQVQYLATAHPAGEGLRLATRMFGVVGKPLSGLLEAAGSGGLDAEVPLGKVVRELAEAIAAEDAPGLVRELLRYVVRGKDSLDRPGAIDLAYAANYGELADALAWVIERNGFIRFFSRLASRSPLQRAASR